jgi:hypothetical protein
MVINTVEIYGLEIKSWWYIHKLILCGRLLILLYNVMDRQQDAEANACQWMGEIALKTETWMWR